MVEHEHAATLKEILDASELRLLLGGYIQKINVKIENIKSLPEKMHYTDFEPVLLGAHGQLDEIKELLILAEKYALIIADLEKDDEEEGENAENK